MVTSRRLSYTGLALVVLGALSLMSHAGTGMVRWLSGLYWMIWVLAGLLELYILFWLVKSREGVKNKLGMFVVFLVILMLFVPTFLGAMFSFILSFGFVAGHINGFDRYCGNCDYDAMNCYASRKPCEYENTRNCVCCDCYTKYSFDACTACFLHDVNSSFCYKDGKCNLDR